MVCLKRKIGYLQQRLVSVEEEEKRRISRELHDEAGQLLATSIFRLDLCAAGLPPDSQSATGVLTEVRGIMTECATRIHELSVSLRPPMLDDLGLTSTIEWYIRASRLDTGATFNLVSEVQEDILSSEIRTAAFRIIQEAVTNAVKHASATEISVRLTSEEGALKLSVQDNGIGFDPIRVRQAASSRGALGLVGMRERAELLNGNLRVLSSLGRGTRISAHLPLIRRPHSPENHRQLILVPSPGGEEYGSDQHFVSG